MYFCLGVLFSFLFTAVHNGELLRLLRLHKHYSVSTQVFRFPNKRRTRPVGIYFVQVKRRDTTVTATKSKRKTKELSSRHMLPHNLEPPPPPLQNQRSPSYFLKQDQIVALSADTELSAAGVSCQLQRLLKNSWKCSSCLLPNAPDLSLATPVLVRLSLG